MDLRSVPRAGAPMFQDAAHGRTGAITAPIVESKQVGETRSVNDEGGSNDGTTRTRRRIDLSPLGWSLGRVGRSRLAGRQAPAKGHLRDDPQGSGREATERTLQ